jgi:hypothetical protein
MTTIQICTGNFTTITFMQYMIDKFQNNLDEIRKIKREKPPYPWVVDKIIAIAEVTLKTIGKVGEMYKKNNWEIRDNEKLRCITLLTSFQKIIDSYPSQFIRYSMFFCCCGMIMDFD